MIPKTLHYCFGMSPNDRPWSLSHYVCIRSAIEHIKPERVNFYSEYVPQGPWWRLTEPLLNVVPIKAPRDIFGNPVRHPAHRADIIRLQKLLEQGGIYLDTDVLVHRGFDDLLAASVVMGQQEGNGGTGLCNAVILAEKNAPFLQRWYGEYRTFNCDLWDEHSVRVPMRLARAQPGDVTVLPQDAFFDPSWDPEGLRRIFGSDQPAMASRYANHLWEGLAWQQHLHELTPGRVRRVNSNFHSWARRYVAELPDAYGRPSKLAKIVKRLGPAVRRRLWRTSVATP